MNTSSQSFVKKTRWKWMMAMMEMKMNNKKKLPSDQRRVRSIKQSRSRLSHATVCLLLREPRFDSQLSFTIDKSIRKKNKYTRIFKDFSMQQPLGTKNDSLLRILRFPGYFETPPFRTFFPFPLGLQNSRAQL